MIKKFVLLLIIVLLTFPAGFVAGAEGQIQVTLNGKTVKFSGASPLRVEKTVLVPIRPIAEELGAEMKWDAQGRKLTVTTFARTAVLVMGSRQMKVNEKTVELDTPPQLVKTSVLVPLTALKAFGVGVTWTKGQNSVGLNPEFTVVKKYVFPVLVASIRFRGQYEEISEVYTALDSKVKNVANGKGFSLYYEQNYEAGHDTEVCIPISEVVEGAFIEHKGQKVPVVTKMLEGGYFLSVVHQGTPETLGNVWAQMDQYAKNTGARAVSPSREVYVQEDLKDYRKQVTEILLKLEDL